MEAIAAALALVALRVAGAEQAPASQRVTAAGSTRVNVTVTEAALAGAARLVRVAVEAFVARRAVGAFVAERARALDLAINNIHRC